MVEVDYAASLKKYRKKNHISQQTLADRIGVTHQSISLIENGVTRPSRKNSRKLLLILEEANCIKEKHSYHQYNSQIPTIYLLFVVLPIEIMLMLLITISI